MTIFAGVGALVSVVSTTLLGLHAKRFHPLIQPVAPLAVLLIAVGWLKPPV